MRHPLVLCHYLLATLLSQAMKRRVLQVSRDVGSRLERLGAAVHGASNGFSPVSRHVTFEVMCPSTFHTANLTDIRLVV